MLDVATCQIIKTYEKHDLTTYNAKSELSTKKYKDRFVKAINKRGKRLK